MWKNKENKNNKEKGYKITKRNNNSNLPSVKKKILSWLLDNP